ncbi:MAG: electron transfer flavoprotein subunit beta/FixA family protein [bacterium]
MDSIVCIKRVPQTTDLELKIDSSGKDIQKDRLTFDINESDSYAIEEAIRLKEKLGGTVTLVSIGEIENDDIIRMGLAKGADSAIRIEYTGELDGFATAQLLKNTIKDLKFDIIFTGCMAQDDGYSMVGQTLAELLGIPYASLVVKLDVENNLATINRELEGSLIEKSEIKLPALFTIQTGINEPRYASLMAIRKAAGKEIKIADAKNTELAKNTTITKLFTPPPSKQAEILAGTTEEKALKLTEILKEKGVL